MGRGAKPFNAHKTEAEAEAGQSQVVRKMCQARNKTEGKQHTKTSITPNWPQKRTKGTAGRETAGAGDLVQTPRPLTSCVAWNKVLGLSGARRPPRLHAGTGLCGRLTSSSPDGW